jgi:hypothetical protein
MQEDAYFQQQQQMAQHSIAYGYAHPNYIVANQQTSMTDGMPAAPCMDLPIRSIIADPP